LGSEGSEFKSQPSSQPSIRGCRKNAEKCLAVRKKRLHDIDLIDDTNKKPGYSLS